jgi:tRNA-binding protein
VERKPQIEFEDFLKADIRVGTVITAALNPKARKPAFVLEIDFGPLGILKSSAQLTQNHSEESLTGTQVVAVVNFPAKRVAGVKSECLVLGAVCEENGIVCLGLTKKVENGSPIG